MEGRFAAIPTADLIRDSASVRSPLPRASFQVERRDELALAIHQVDQRGVVHGVVAVLERDLSWIDPVGREHLGHRLGIAGQALQMRIEAER